MFEKISYSVFLILVGIIVVTYSINANNNDDIEVYNKALITEKEAAQYLSMDIEQFQKLVKDEETLKKEAIGLKVDPNAILDFWTYDEEKYFSPAQINKWIEYNMAKTTPIIPE